MPDRASSSLRRRPRGHARSPAVVALLLLIVAGRSAAQESPLAPHTQWELRADALLARTPAAALGVGVNVPFATYLRTGIVVSAGPGRSSDGTHGLLRAEFMSRYLLDPFRELRWGVYGGAGLAAQWSQGSRDRVDLLLLAGLEGPAAHGWHTSLEVALGGGARLSVALRRTRRNGR